MENGFIKEENITKIENYIKRFNMELPDLEDSCNLIKIEKEWTLSNKYLENLLRTYNPSSNSISISISIVPIDEDSYILLELMEIVEGEIYSLMYRHPNKLNEIYLELLINLKGDIKNE